MKIQAGILRLQMMIYRESGTHPYTALGVNFPVAIWAVRSNWFSKSVKIFNINPQIDYFPNLWKYSASIRVTINSLNIFLNHGNIQHQLVSPSIELFFQVCANIQNNILWHEQGFQLKGIYMSQINLIQYTSLIIRSSKYRGVSSARSSNNNNNKLYEVQFKRINVY